MAGRLHLLGGDGDRYASNGVPAIGDGGRLRVSATAGPMFDVLVSLMVFLLVGPTFDLAVPL